MVSTCPTIRNNSLGRNAGIEQRCMGGIFPIAQRSTPHRVCRLWKGGRTNISTSLWDALSPVQGQAVPRLNLGSTRLRAHYSRQVHLTRLLDCLRDRGDPGFKLRHLRIDGDHPEAPRTTFMFFRPLVEVLEIGFSSKETRIVSSSDLTRWIVPIDSQPWDEEPPTYKDAKI